MKFWGEPVGPAPITLIFRYARTCSNNSAAKKASTSGGASASRAVCQRLAPVSTLRGLVAPRTWHRGQHFGFLHLRKRSTPPSTYAMPAQTFQVPPGLPPRRGRARYRESSQDGSREYATLRARRAALNFTFQPTAGPHRFSSIEKGDRKFNLRLEVGVKASFCAARFGKDGIYAYLADVASPGH